MALHTDDMLVMSNCDAMVDRWIAEIQKQFNIKSLGEPKRFLGLDWEETDDYIATLLIDTIKPLGFILSQCLTGSRRSNY